MKYFFILILLLNILPVTAAERVLVRISNPEPEILKDLKPSEYDIAGYKPGEYLDIVVSESESAEIQNKGYAFEIMRTEQDIKTNLHSDRNLPGYSDYETILMELEIIAASYPGLCELYDIGDTRGIEYTDAGNDNYSDYYHDIWALKLSDNVSTEEDEPNIYYFGVHHAREPITAETVLLILYHLLDNYGSDPDITNAIDNSQIWFVPLVNPNGHKIVWDEEDVWWRKNIRDNNENGFIDDSNWNGCPDGVDNNRNYGYEWGLVGASSDPLEETYHGPEAFSEPENLALKDLIDNRHFVAGISYHTHGELVLFPFGYNEGVTAPDREALNDLAVEIALATPSQYGGYYTPQESWLLYPLMGGLDDYAYGIHGTFAYTIEMATEFIPPANMVSEISQDNLEGALILLDRVFHSSLTGHITESTFGEPFMAEIFVEGVDNTGVYKPPHTSDAVFGSYYRLLQDGDYTVSFSAFGYETQTFYDVNINNTGQTILDVVMNQAPVTEITGTVYDFDTMEPIGEATAEILNTPLESAFTNINGEFTMSEVPYGTYNIRISAEDYIGTIEEITVDNNSTVFIFLLHYSTAESFENDEFSQIWYFSGDDDWFIDDEQSYDGIHSARSGPIGGNQTSSLICNLDVTAASPLIFYKKVSCEDDNNDNYDYLAFFIDGYEIDRWDGEVDWSEEYLDIDPGSHTFEWRYVKDGYVSSGSDCGWIDFVTLPLTMKDTVIPNPTVIDLELETDQIFVETLDIVNTGIYDVDYSISTSEPLDWITSLLPGSGTLTADGGSVEIAVTFDTSGLENGEYSCDLVLSLSQSQRTDILIPVMLSVSSTEENEEELPAITGLYANYPNPFNPDTTIKFDLKTDSTVRVDIFNLKGQIVKTLIDEVLEAGNHSTVWYGKDSNGNPVASGLYLYRMTAGSFSSTRKMVLMK